MHDLQEPNGGILNRLQHSPERNDSQSHPRMVHELPLGLNSIRVCAPQVHDRADAAQAQSRKPDATRLDIAGQHIPTDSSMMRSTASPGGVSGWGRSCFDLDQGRGSPRLNSLDFRHRQIQDWHLSGLGREVGNMVNPARELGAPSYWRSRGARLSSWPKSTTCSPTRTVRAANTTVDCSSPALTS